MAFYKDVPNKRPQKVNHANQGSWDDEGAHYRDRAGSKRFGPASEEGERPYRGSRNGNGKSSFNDRSGGDRRSYNNDRRPYGDDRRSAPRDGRFDRASPGRIVPAMPARWKHPSPAAIVTLSIVRPRRSP